MVGVLWFSNSQAPMLLSHFEPGLQLLSHGAIMECVQPNCFKEEEQIANVENKWFGLCFCQLAVIEGGV